MRVFLLRVLLCLFISASVTSCGESQLSDKQLIGAWVLSKESGDPFQLSQRHLSPKLVFHERGRFDAVNFPGEIFFPLPRGHAVSIAGNGSWKKRDSENGLPVIGLVFEDGEQLKERVPYGITLFVSSTAGHPVLSYFQGDPDTDAPLVFERESKPSVSTGGGGGPTG